MLAKGSVVKGFGATLEVACSSQWCKVLLLTHKNQQVISVVHIFVVLCESKFRPRMFGDTEI